MLALGVAANAQIVPSVDARMLHTLRGATLSQAAAGVPFTKVVWNFPFTGALVVN